MATFQELLSEIDAPAEAKQAVSAARHDLEVGRKRHEMLRDLHERDRKTMTYLAAKQSARDVVEAEQVVARLKKAFTDAAGVVTSHVDPDNPPAIIRDQKTYTRLIEAEYVLIPFPVAEATADEESPPKLDVAPPPINESQEGTGIQGGAS